MASHSVDLFLSDSTNAEDEYLDLCYTVDTAKLAFQRHREGRQAEPMFTQSGEHLCVRTYTATGTTQTVVKPDNAPLTPDEVKKQWPEVMSAIKKELAT